MRSNGSNGSNRASPDQSVSDKAPAGAGASGVFLRVVPNARKTEVVGTHGEAVKLKVASPAMEGKANAAVLEFVSATAGVPLRAAVLVAGAKSRDKVVRVEGMTAQELRTRLLETQENEG